jgi:hypothetical protein
LWSRCHANERQFMHQTLVFLWLFLSYFFYIFRFMASFFFSWLLKHSSFSLIYKFFHALILWIKHFCYM